MPDFIISVQKECFDYWLPILTFISSTVTAIFIIMYWWETKNIVRLSRKDYNASVTVSLSNKFIDNFYYFKGEKLMSGALVDENDYLHIAFTCKSNSKGLSYFKINIISIILALNDDKKYSLLINSNNHWLIVKPNDELEYMLIIDTTTDNPQLLIDMINSKHIHNSDKFEINVSFYISYKSNEEPFEDSWKCIIKEVIPLNTGRNIFNGLWVGPIRSERE